ncbi:MAG: NUDIX hydrolase N-terminal domain-containing protein [Candidatus Limivivens sp.]|nr:NUDIX hydrolase N-terminal domain-containing protein [Candidatus Limivivens sp.]
MANENQWLDWIIELQSLAQSGLYYGKDVYDRERYERIREIAALMMSRLSDQPLKTVRDLFCNETGYQTPKLDTRGAIFNDQGKILLVHEKNGTWSLPGGWVDVNTSIKENVEKEVWEEAGLLVTAERILAVEDRNKHNLPRYAYGVCKIFLLCSVQGGSFRENSETMETAYFSEEELPLLAEEKCNEEQIRMCFAAYRDENWKPFFD